jgi:SET domain-containing protein
VPNVPPGAPPNVPPNDLPFEIRPSPIQGLGAFATRAIPAGTRLIEYAGARLTMAEAEARYPDVAGARHHTFLFALEDVVDGEDVEVVVDASVDGNEARFLNHGCAPNCDVVVEDARLWIETLRDVAPGEELTYDYAFVLPERHTPAAKRRYPCACGAPSCRGTMLIPKKQAR